MKIIHQNEFSREELLTYRMTVYRNLVDSAQAIVLSMRKIGIDCETPSNRVRYLFIEKFYYYWLQTSFGCDLDIMSSLAFSF
jgi:hypothetical protein